MFYRTQGYAFVNPQDRFEPTPLGIALVRGYENTNIDLLNNLKEPYLRAAMERDMTQISIGAKQKGAFLSECLGEMKRVRPRADPIHSLNCVGVD